MRSLTLSSITFSFVGHHRRQSIYNIVWVHENDEGPPAFPQVDIIGAMVGWLEFNVPFQHKYGYIRYENPSNNDCLEDNRENYRVCSVQQLCLSELIRVFP